MTDLPIELARLTERLRARGLSLDVDGTANAAVAMILRDGLSGVEALFIRRAERDGDPWSGHVAFPGGRRDARDASLLETALRETEEEVGLRLSPTSLVARLDDVAPRAGTTMRVAQFVFATHDRDARIVANAEVAATLWVPLSHLTDPKNATTIKFARAGVAIDLPAVNIGDHVLWGMTYRMAQQLIEVIAEPR